MNASHERVQGALFHPDKSKASLRDVEQVLAETPAPRDASEVSSLLVLPCLNTLREQILFGFVAGRFLTTADAPTLGKDLDNESRRGLLKALRTYRPGRQPLKKWAHIVVKSVLEEEFQRLSKQNRPGVAPALRFDDNPQTLYLARSLVEPGYAGSALHPSSDSGGADDDNLSVEELEDVLYYKGTPLGLITGSFGTYVKLTEREVEATALYLYGNLLPEALRLWNAQNYESLVEMRLILLNNVIRPTWTELGNMMKPTRNDQPVDRGRACGYVGDAASKYRTTIKKLPGMAARGLTQSAVRLAIAKKRSY